MFGRSVPDFVGLHLPWQDDENALTVRFEDPNGLIAAYFPARRAAKLNVLEAISYE